MTADPLWTEPIALCESLLSGAKLRVSGNMAVGARQSKSRRVVGGLL